MHSTDVPITRFTSNSPGCASPASSAVLGIGRGEEAVPGTGAHLSASHAFAPCAVAARISRPADGSRREGGSGSKRKREETEEEEDAVRSECPLPPVARNIAQSSAAAPVVQDDSQSECLVRNDPPAGQDDPQSECLVGDGHVAGQDDYASAPDEDEYDLTDGFVVPDDESISCESDSEEERERRLKRAARRREKRLIRRSRRVNGIPRCSDSSDDEHGDDTEQ